MISHLQVDTDGWIAFGQSIEDAEPETFPPTSADVFWTFVIAPFWGNLSSISSGLVSWEIHNNTHSPEIFDLVNEFIEYEYGDGNFNGTWMFIGFWEDLLASETISNVSYRVILTIIAGINSIFFCRIIPFKLSW